MPLEGATEFGLRVVLRAPVTCRCEDRPVSTVIADLVTRLNRDGYEAVFNAKYGTIDVVRINGRPLLDPWPLQIRPHQLHEVLASVQDREHVGASEALALLAAMIASDIGTYPSTDGPFVLDRFGYVTRPHIE